MGVVFCGKEYRGFNFMWRVLNPDLHCGLKYQFTIYLRYYCVIVFTGISKKEIIQNVCRNFPELKQVAIQAYNKKFEKKIGSSLTGKYSDKKGVEIIDDNIPF